MDDRRRCRHVCELHFVCALVIKLPSLKNTHTAHTQKNIFWFCRLMVRVSWVVTNAVNLSIFPAAVNAVISFHYTQTLFNVIFVRRSPCSGANSLRSIVSVVHFASPQSISLFFVYFIFFFTSAYCSWSHWKKTILRGGDGCEQTRVFKRPSGHLPCRSMWKTSTIFSRAPASTRWKPAMEWRLFFFGWGGGILTTFRENEVESLKKNANTVTRRCH